MANHGACKSSARDADKRNERAVRKCLKCGKLFWSEHRGNRRCDGCCLKLASVFDWTSVRNLVAEVLP